MRELELYAEHQERLREEIDKIVRPMLEQPDQEDTANAATRLAAERELKRLELESLAQTLRNKFPDLRQCQQCGIGLL